MIRKPVQMVMVGSFGILVSLLAFQNCGNPKGFNAKLHSASTLSAQQTSQSNQVEPQSDAKQIIIRIKRSYALDQVNLTSLPSGAFGLAFEQSWQELNMSLYSFANQYSAAQVKQAILEDPSLAEMIEFIEPNQTFTLPPDEAANQALATLQEIQSLPQPANGSRQTNADIGLADLWSRLPANNEAPIVAVIDSGIDTQHEIFKNTGALWVNAREVAGNGVDDDQNGFIDDIHGYDFLNKKGQVTDEDGHGTHCAGIVLGAGQDIFKSNPEPARVRIMGLKFIGQNGGQTSDAISAIYYAVRNGARVLSNSWGGANVSRALEEAIAYAYDHDVVFVAAAGNSKQNTDSTPVYPSSFRIPNLVSVAATDDNDQLASFSNFGVNSVDLSSPGVSILSLAPNNQYRRMSGTSMATPFVAGTAALMLYERPEMKAHQIRSLILGTATVKPLLNGYVLSKARLQANQAVAEAKTAVLDNNKPSYQRKVAGGPPSSPSNGETESGKPSGCGTVGSFSKDRTPGSGLFALLVVLMPMAFLLAIRRRFHSTMAL